MKSESQGPKSGRSPSPEGEGTYRLADVGLPTAFGLQVSDFETRSALDLPMRLVRKRGRPLLFLPSNRRAAATCLGLYPAQTRRARLARGLLRCVISAGLPFGTEKVRLRVKPDNPFLQFLGSRAGFLASQPPAFGVLAGNPETAGQRFLVLVFDPGQKPVAVVKTGFSDRARELIQKEESFLSTVPARLPGIPQLRAAFQSPGVRALALDFYAGDCPGAADAALPALLSSWVDKSRKIAVAEAPDWRKLEQAAAADTHFAAIAGPLRGHTVRATIFHGDLAPWNIKVTPRGDWVVLDWERGELAGLPGWDWFHYVVQPAILVDRMAPAKLVERLATLLNSDAFQAYARDTAILGVERLLALAYLYYCLHVIRPSEGLDATRQLLAALRSRWSV